MAFLRTACRSARLLQRRPWATSRPTWLFAVVIAPVLAVTPGLAPGAASPQMTTTGAIAVPSGNVPRTRVTERACADALSAACQRAVVRAIDDARRSEGTRALRLPSYYSRLRVPQQLLVLAQLERVDRGLPGFTGLSARLDSLARRGAVSDAEPIEPARVSWGSNWAGGEASALLADFDWVYDDGPGSPNLQCTTSHAGGCWSHRRNVLGHYGPHPSMGAAFAVVGGVTSFTELFSSSPAGRLHYRLPGPHTSAFGFHEGLTTGFLIDLASNGFYGTSPSNTGPNC